MDLKLVITKELLIVKTVLNFLWFYS